MILKRKVKKVNNYLNSDSFFTKRLEIFFTVIFYVFTLDFGFVQHKNKNINFLIRLFPIFAAFCYACNGINSFIKLNFISIGSREVLDIMYSLVLSLAYVSSCIISFTHRDKVTFKMYLTNLYNFDKTLGIDPTALCLDTKILYGFYYIIGVFLIHLSICIIVYTNLPAWSIALTYIPLVHSAVNSMISMLIYYGAYTRLKQINVQVRNVKYKDILTWQLSYKYVADLVENATEISNAQYSLSILYHVPLMLVMVSFIIFVHSIMSFGSYLETIILVFISSIQIFAPSFAAGMVSNEAENIAMTLHHARMEERKTGFIQHNHYETFIRYIQARPMKYFVMKVVPLGWSLPVTVLQVVVTYIILILQFSHAI